MTVVRRITKANAYNINFKEDMDYVMYIIVVNSERAEELVDTEQPHRMNTGRAGGVRRAL